MNTSRRDFLKSAGLLTIGFTMGVDQLAYGNPPDDLPESLKRHPNINAWIELLENGHVRVFTGKLELGQGITTAIAQVAAEELNMDPMKVEVVLADTGRTPDEGYTAGSGSMEQSAMAVRYAAAAAREKLLSLAADQSKSAIAGLKLANGFVHAKSGKRILSVKQLLNGKQISDVVKAPVALKAKKDYQVVGTPVKRTDIRQMVTGSEHFVHDLRFPGMLHARVIRPPVYNSELVSFDEAYVKDEAGSDIRVVRNGNFLAVLSENEFSAAKAQTALRQSAKWTQSPLPAAAVNNMKAYLKSTTANRENVHESGIVADSYQHSATYYKPYLMHASMGPSCAVAYYREDLLHIWTHSQGVFPLRASLAALLKIDENKIRLTGVPGAGCYGHNGADDVAADAALIAIAVPGRHIRLQWTREDEHAWEPYGSAMLMEVSASLDSHGYISDWKYELWSDNHSTRPGGKASNLLASQYISHRLDPPKGGYSGGAWRNSQPYYTFANQHIYANIVQGPLRVSALRSLGAYANIFAIESFMDELAVAAKSDPYEFRLRHLQDGRAKTVVRKLRDMVSQAKTKPGEGIGVAFSRYKNVAAYCAVAARVFVDKSAGEVRVLEMWAAIDAGEVINPDGVINQTEGGMIQAASWTVLEEVTFDEQRVTSTDWTTYPIMRFADSPAVHVEVIPMPDEEVLGAGEAAQGPAAAAIANAIFRASGIRVRDLPMRRALKVNTD